MTVTRMLIARPVVPLVMTMPGLIAEIAVARMLLAHPLLMTVRAFRAAAARLRGFVLPGLLSRMLYGFVLSRLRRPGLVLS